MAKPTTHPMRRTDREASETFARQVANDAPYGTLVTASATGEPYGVPVSPVIEGNVIWFHAAANVGRKFDNLTHNPRCAMVFVSDASPDEPAFSMNYRSAMFEGHASIVTNVGRKFDNLTHNPRCAMVFVSDASPDEPAFSMNYRSAMFEGHASIVTDQVEKMHALWLICAKWAGGESLE